MKYIIISLVLGVIIGASVTYAIKPTGVSQEEHKKIVDELGRAIGERDSASDECDIAMSERDTAISERDSYKRMNSELENQIKELQQQIKNSGNANNVKPSYGSDLRVVGNRIVDENGTDVVLRGLAYIDFIHSPERSAKIESDFRVAAEEWHANAMRLPVNGIPNEWYLANLDRMIDVAHEYGMLPIIDYHGFQGSDISDAIKFWSAVSERYKNESSIIFEIFNEPHDITWDDWKRNAETLIDLARQYNPDRVVIVNCLEWGYDLSYVLSDPINRTNIVYGTHPYPNKFWHCGGLDAKEEQKRAEWDRAFGKVAEKYPVIVTEFGWDGYTGQVWGDGDDELYAYPLLRYLDERNIGYLAWNWSDLYGPKLLKSFVTYEPTPSGEVIKSHLLEHSK